MRQTKRQDRRTLYIRILCAIIAWPLVALADDVTQAKDYFDRGLADLKAGHYKTACPAIAESLRLDPQLGTLFTLAACEAEWGHVVSAASRFEEYLRRYEGLSPEEKEQQGERPNVAKEQRDKLQREIARLTLSLPPMAPPGTVVKLDGKTVDKTKLGIALPMDPGEHEIATRAPGGPVRREKINLEKGKWLSVVVQVDRTPTTPLSPPKPLRLPKDGRGKGVITGTENSEVPISMAMRRMVLPHLTLSPYIEGDYARGDFMFGTADLGALNVGFALGLGGDIQIDADLIGFGFNGEYKSSFMGSGLTHEPDWWWARSSLGGTVRLFATDRVEIGIRSHVLFDRFGGLGVSLGFPFRFHFGRFVRMDGGVFTTALPMAKFETWLAESASNEIWGKIPSPGIPLKICINPIPAFFLEIGTGISIHPLILEPYEKRTVMMPFNAAVGGTIRLGTRGRLDITGRVTLPLAQSDAAGVELGFPAVGLLFPVVGLGLRTYFPLTTPARPHATIPSRP